MAALALRKMKFIRRGKITNAEALVLLDALREKRKLSFPMDVPEIRAVIRSFERAERLEQMYTLSSWERLLAAWNFSYGSLTKFVTWFEPGKLSLSHIQDSSGRDLLLVSLIEGSVNWQKMKSSGLV